MARPEPTYAEYRAWGGKLAQDRFETALPAARAAVREVTGFNEPETADESQAYANAVCAACDVVDAYGGTAVAGGIGGASIGSFSYSQGTVAPQDGFRIDVVRAVRGELSGTGLLYQGIG